MSTPEKDGGKELGVGDQAAGGPASPGAALERLDLALRGGDLGLWDWDVKTGALHVDDRWAAMLGYSRAEIEPHVRSLEQLIHPDDRSLAAEARNAHLEGRTPHEQFEHRMRSKSGEWIWVLHRGKVVERDREGRPLRLVGTHLDVTERKQAELALRESRRALATLLGNLPGMAYRCRNDRDWTMEFVSEGCAELTGYQAEELVGDTKVAYADLIHPDDRPQVWEEVQAALRDRRPFRLNYRIRTAAGEERWVWEQGTGVFDEDEELEALEGFICDVTERKRSEQVLRDRGNLLRTVINATKEAMISIDAKGLIRLFNPAAEEMFGRTKADMVGRSPECLMPEEYRGPHRGYVTSYFATGKPDEVIGKTVELPGLRSDGEVFPMEISLAAGELGDKQFVIAVARDITERKQAEERLRRERNFSNSLVQASPTFFVAISREGKVLMMNEAMLTSLGYTEDEVVGTDYLATYVPESDRASLAGVFEKLVTSNEPTLNENRVLTKDGRELLVEWHGRPVFDEKGSFDFFFGVGIDVTERRRAEEERRKLEAQVQQAQKLESLGVLAGGIAHDFNNLLVGILGNADLALDQLSPTAPARPRVNDIETAAKRAAELTRQMLAYSGKGRFVVEPLDLNELVREMTHLLEVSISKRAILKYNYADNLPPIEADGTQVRQVIMNLITNASEALGETSGAISISSSAIQCDRDYLRETYLAEELPEGVYVCLETADTGCGMDSETLKRIFDPFYSTKSAGRGLGLAAVLGIMRGHGGALRVKSESGKGTTFQVLFPAAARSAAPVREVPQPVRTWHGTGTVLLVDDEETVRAVGTQFLERAGYKVLTAPDGPEAVELFRQHAADVACVVLDLTMPHMDGEEAFRRLRDIRGDVPVIMSSGYNEQEVTRRFVGQGLAGFIQKPYRGAELLAKVGEAMGQRPSDNEAAPEAE